MNDHIAELERLLIPPSYYTLIRVRGKNMKIVKSTGTKGYKNHNRWCLQIPVYVVTERKKDNAVR